MTKGGTEFFDRHRAPKPKSTALDVAALTCPAVDAVTLLPPDTGWGVVNAVKAIRVAKKNGLRWVRPCGVARVLPTRRVAIGP